MSLRRRVTRVVNARRGRQPPPKVRRLLPREEYTEVEAIERDDFASDTLLLILSGMNTDVTEDDGKPAGMGFEFHRLAKRMPVKRMFVRDPYHAWYQRGLPGTEESFDGALELVRREVLSARARRLVVVGNSAGGYAALIFGTMLRADVVLSFSPQTTLDLEAQLRIGDKRWEDRLRPLLAHGLVAEQWADAGQVLRRETDGTAYRVFVDDSFDLDRWHANRVAGLEGVRLYRFGDRGGHRLVRNLRDSGALEVVLNDAV
jgi:hypothetical protein